MVELISSATERTLRRQKLLQLRIRPKLFHAQGRTGALTATRFEWRSFGFARVAQDFPKRCRQFLKKVLKPCSQQIKKKI